MTRSVPTAHRRRRRWSKPPSGTVVRPQQTSDVPSEERTQHALDLAYRYLGRRDRTVAEVRTRLEAEHVEADVIDATVAELEGQGHLDDARYAQRFAEDRRTIDAWGPERIERRLLAV